MDYSRQIKILRQKLILTQTEFAELLGLVWKLMMTSKTFLPKQNNKEI